MSGKSVSGGRRKMWISQAFFTSLLIHCLCGDDSLNYSRVICGNNNPSTCVVEAFFGNSATDAGVDLLVNCTKQVELSSDQFNSVDRVVWKSCRTSPGLEGFALRMIPRKSRVKQLQIEKFASGSLRAGTFDGFLGLEVLSLEHNFIGNLSSSCFRGLRSLRVLRMIENGLEWIEAGVFGDIAKLSVLDIQDTRHLLIANHQFRENQIVENVAMEMNSFEADLLENFLRHVRNLSISVAIDEATNGCDQIRIDGYEKHWITESLKLHNLKCGFVLKNFAAVKSLQLVRSLEKPYTGLELHETPLLEALVLHENFFGDFSSIKFGGVFDRLTFLDISNNSFPGDMDMRVFEGFGNLRKLKLVDNALKKLSHLDAEKFPTTEFFVDGNSFDCSWLNEIAEHLGKFNFTKNFTSFNIDGLSCSFGPSDCSPPPPPAAFLVDNRAQRELLELKKNNFILGPEVLMIMVCAGSLLGVALTFVSIYLYHRRRILKKKPFYHLLRDSLVRPSTLQRDLSQIISRNLPPTNYEHPISDSMVTEMTDVEASAGNIYEEIPPKEASA